MSRHSLIDSKGVWTSNPSKLCAAAITEGEGGRPDVMKLAGRQVAHFWACELIACSVMTIDWVRLR